MRRLRIYLCVLALVMPATAQENAVIYGSDTMILLGQRLSQIYRRNHPSFQISIRGGGTPAGMAALAERKANVVQEEGAPTSQAKGAFSLPVGVQGLVVYVNNANPINELTVAQVRDIFLGKITNWKMLGGTEGTILLYAGESSTGNLDFFQGTVLGGQEPYPFVGKDSAKDMLDVLATEPRGIGYTSFSSNPGVKALRIKMGAASVGVEPTIANIRSRQYPISRQVYWTLAQRPSQDLKDFCEWVLSQEGQLVVESVGFEPVTVESRNRDLARLGSTLPSTSVSVR